MANRGNRRSVAAMVAIGVGMVLAFGARSTTLCRVSANDELPIYQLLGADGISAIVAGFYRQVPDDPILGPMYPKQDFAGAEQRLRSFLIYRFGGPPDYLRDRGHPRLRIRHAPFVVDQAARDRWMELMLRSIDAQVAAGKVQKEHRDYLATFLGDIATFLINR